MAVWQVYTDTFATGELLTPSKYQAMIPEDNIMVTAIRTWVTYSGLITLENLRLNIYSKDVQNDAPSTLLHTSTTGFDLSDIKETYDYGVKGLGFSFDNVRLRGGDTYYLVLSAGQYIAPTTDDRLGWVKAWPDPNIDYTQTYTVNGSNFNTAPFRISGVLGAKI